MHSHNNMQAATPDSLLTAFQQTHYKVFAPGISIDLRIGQYSAALASLMSEYGKDTAAILTAYNPEAKPAGIQANRHAQQSLRHEIRTLGLTFFDGENVAPNQDGPTEPTVVVLGINRREAHALAQQFGQLAFVLLQAHCAPELMWVGQSY